MYFTGLEILHDNIKQLRIIYQVNENIRKHFAEDGDLTERAHQIGAQNYLNAQNSIPSQITWRTHDYSAFITQLYALYEAFAYDLIRQWLKFLPSLYSNWNDIPQKIKNSYRNAIGNALSKYNIISDEVDEKDLVEGFYFGLSGNQNYSFIAKAFFIGLPNLRKEELSKLFKVVGMEEIDRWLDNINSRLGTHCAVNSYSVEGRLREFISYRNDCAHGPVDISDLLGFSELLEISEFIFLICDALVEFGNWTISHLAEIQKIYENLGKVTEYFPKADAWIIKTKQVKFVTGETVAIRTKTEFYHVDLKSIQVDSIDVTDVDTIEGQEIGIKVSKPIKKGAEIIRT